MNPWRGLGVLPREVWYVCLAILVNRAGTMVLPFLTLYLTIDRRLSVSSAGITLTAYGIGSILIAPLSGRLSDRLGALRIMKISLFVSGLLLFIYPFANNLASILTITAAWAIASEAFRPPSMSMIGDLAGPTHRKAAFALCRLAINIGMSIGPVVGGFLAMHSFKLLFYFDGSTTLLAALILVALPWQIKPDAGGNPQNEDPHEGPHAAKKSSPLYSDVLKDRRFLYFLLAMIPVELVFFQPIAAMPLFLVRDLHFTEAGYGMLFAVNTVIIILVEVRLNMSMSSWSHPHALALGAALVGIGFGALVFVNGVVGAVATIVIWTFGEMILLPASAAYVSDVAPPEQSGAYMGLYTMGFSLAFAIGPWLGMQVMEAFGPSAVWLGTFACGCITAMMMWLLPKRSTAVQEPELNG